MIKKKKSPVTGRRDNPINFKKKSPQKSVG